MMEVIALTRFDHHGMKERNDVFEVSDPIGKKLIAKGLVAQHEVTKKTKDDSPPTGDQKATTNTKAKGTGKGK